MSERQVIEDLARDIRARLDARDAEFDAKVEQAVAAAVDGLADDHEFVRKIRFAKGDPRLAGSPYGRMGLTATDIEMAHSIVVAGGKTPSEQLENAFRAVSDAEYMTTYQAKQQDVRHIEDMLIRGHLDQVGFKKAIAAVDQVYGRAMDTAESGYGSQLIGAQYAADLWTGARAQSRIFSLLPTFQMDAPTTYLPVEADVPELLYVAESTANNSSNYTTSKTGSNRVQVDAKKFVIHQMWSGEIEEDAVVAFIVFLRQQAQRSLEHYSDSVVLNGDTTNAGTGNINLDDADPADTKHYLALDGIRHAFLVDATGQGVNHSGAALTYDAIVALRKKGVDTTYLHDWFHPTNPADAVFVIDPEGADNLAQLDEVQTVDKYGSMATVLNGEVGMIGRNPVIASIAMSKTEADGKVSTTAGNNTLHQVALFNRRGFAVGIRRALKIETERLPATDQTRIVYSLRMGLGRYTPTGAAAGIKSVAGLYNIAA